VVIIGIDPHKASHTAAALDDRHQLLDCLRVPANAGAVRRLLRWARHWPERRWAIEGAHGLGRLLAQQLLAAGEQVVDVPAKLSARVRVLERGHGRKTDAADAASVAAAAFHHPGLREVVVEDHAAVLRLLSDRRDQLNEERRRTVNRLHTLLRDLHPGGANRCLRADAAAALLRRIRPATAVQAERKLIARELLRDLRRLDRALAANRRRCAEAVATSGTTLTELVGVSDVLAAKIIGHTGDVGRFPSADHYGSYTGTAPVEASSGDIRRHRLNRGGNRALNNALHLIARTQLNHHPAARAHYQRKLAEAKTTDEAFRSLKRQLAKIVYRQLSQDAARGLQAPCLT
jgi:transposase